MIQSIEREINTMSKNIKGLETNLMKDKFVDEACPPNEALKELEILEKTIGKLKEKNETFTKVQKLMNITPAPNKELADLETKFNDRKRLWNDVDKFNKVKYNW